MDGRKLCGKCGDTKPLSEFHTSNRRGWQAWCKTCSKEYSKNRHLQRGLMIDKLLVDEKVCLHCGMLLPAAEFYRHACSPDGLRSSCIECQSLEKRAKKYRLTFADVAIYLQVPECQNPNCRMPFPPGAEGDRLMHFDHCHGRGHMRGVLCSRCNTAAAGQVYECIERLRGLIDYLKRSEARLNERKRTRRPA